MEAENVESRLNAALRVDTHKSALKATEPKESGSNDVTPRTSEDANYTPYWTSPTRAIRSISNSSYLASRGQIRLEDHSEESHELSQGCWAKSAAIDDYVLVSGPTGIGAYVVWHCIIQTLKGGDLILRKRYSEFDTLRRNLIRSFPHTEGMIPLLPRKSVVSRFRPEFLEQRQAGLSHFLNCVLLNPEFAGSPVLKEFVFSN